MAESGVPSGRQPPIGTRDQPFNTYRNLFHPRAEPPMMIFGEGES